MMRDLTRFREVAASPTTAGLLMLVGGCLFLAFVFGMRGSFSSLVSGPDRTVTAEFASAQQLRKGDPVRIDGVEVGRVGGIDLAADGRRAKVELELDETAGPLYADASARLRWRTALGGAFFVDLNRGSPQKPPLSGAIPVQRTAGQIELEDVTALVRGRARRALRTLPGDLADALDDPEPPAAAMKALADAAPNLRRGLHAVRGQRKDEDLRRLVSETAATVRALDAPDDALRVLVAGAAATLRTTAARGAEIRSTLASAPGVLGHADTTLRRLQGTLDRVDPLLERLHEPAGDLAPTLAELRPTVAGADRLLRRARPLLRSLRPAVTSLAGMARDGLPVVEDVRPSVRRLDDVILPFLGERDPESLRTTAQMIGPTLATVGGEGGQEDSMGSFQRISLSVGNSPLYLPCNIFISNPDVKELIACRTLKGALNSLFNYNPFGPMPGTDGVPPEVVKP